MTTPQIFMPEVISSLGEVESVGIDGLKNFGGVAFALFPAQQ